MNHKITPLLSCLMFWLTASCTLAQSEQNVPAKDLVTKSVNAIGFPVGRGGVKVDLKGTELMTQASGEAKVEAKQGKTNIEVSVIGLEPPTKLGAEFLTFVLWVVTPDGRTGNLGELIANKNGEAKLNATTPAQTFSLIVTAEPYFAVRLPSEIVIMGSEARKNTKGKLFPVKEYKLMKRGQYEKLGNPLAMTPDIERVPLELYEARNAVDIAKSRGAEADALADDRRHEPAQPDLRRVRLRATCQLVGRRRRAGGRAVRLRIRFRGVPALHDPGRRGRQQDGALCDLHRVHGARHDAARTQGRVDPGTPGLREFLPLGDGVYDTLVRGGRARADRSGVREKGLALLR